MVDPLHRYVDGILETMGIDKGLPKIRYEAMASVFLAPFLPEILHRKFGWHGVRVVVPEFPLKKQENNQSTNVDFLLTAETTDCPERGGAPGWIAVELKTDVRSMGREQLRETASHLARHTMTQLMANVSQIAGVSERSEKYAALVERLGQHRIGDDQVDFVYLSPVDPKERHGDKLDGIHYHSVTFHDMVDWIHLSPHPEAWELIRTRVIPRILE